MIFLKNTLSLRTLIKQNRNKLSMELNVFIKNFEAQFEDVEQGTLINETEFRGIDGWDSMTALFVIAMVDEIYNVKITGDDIRSSKTISDIYKIVSSRTTQ